MLSCTPRTLHVSGAVAIPGYAAQLSVRAGSVIAHLASLNRSAQTGPSSPGRDTAVAAHIADIHPASEINGWPDDCVVGQSCH